MFLKIALSNLKDSKGNLNVLNLNVLTKSRKKSQRKSKFIHFDERLQKLSLKNYHNRPGTCI